MIRMMKSSMFQRSLKTDKFQSYEHSPKESWNTNFSIHENVHYNCDLPKYEVANNIIFTNYSLLTRHFVLTIFSAENNELIARRLDKKLGSDLFCTKQDFLANSFSHLTLPTAEYSSGYSLFMSYSMICFWIGWVCVYKYTKIKGLDWGGSLIYFITEEQNRDEHGALFHLSPKKNGLLITRHSCIQWTFTTTDQLASPLKFYS